MLDFDGANGVPFRAVIETDGARDGATVAFFDRRYMHTENRRYMHTENGQFISDYYVTTLLDDVRPNGGLMLYGGIDDWTLDAESFAMVRAWLIVNAETLALWDALRHAENLDEAIYHARRDGASWPFISHATRLTGDQCRDLFKRGRASVRSEVHL